MTKRTVLCMMLVGALGWFCLIGAPSAYAGEDPSKYPTQPIRMIGPFAPGGASDFAARLLQPTMSEFLGKQVVIENRAGVTRRWMPSKRSFKRRPKGMAVGLRVTGCHGFCERGPLVVLHPRQILYQRVKPEDASMIFEETVLKGKVIESLLYEDPTTGEKISTEEEVPFYKKQRRIIFGNNGSVDPTQIEDYIPVGAISCLT